MVPMSFTLKIKKLKRDIVDIGNLSGVCYHYLHGNLGNQSFDLLNKYTGAIERVAAHGFMGIPLDFEELEVAFTQVTNQKFEKFINVYHIIGICLQYKFINNYQYQALVEKWFVNHSYRIQFIISQVFDEYEPRFKKNIELVENTWEGELVLLKSISSKKEWNQSSFPEVEFKDDIISLLILEVYEERKRHFYDKDKESLLDLVMFCATEIQSKHRVLNNNEDQFNGLIHSLLSKDFIVEPQSQRGVSGIGKSFGELDLAIFTKEDKYPLGIFEAFILRGMDRTVISKHLKKLMVSYDPNGLTRNYVFVYCKIEDLQALWQEYLEYVSSYDYDLELTDQEVYDVSKNYPTFSNIRIGVGNHLNGSTPIELYHIFMKVI